MSNKPLEELLAGLHWLGHDCFRLDGPPVIYFDPWKLAGRPPVADLVLVSHDHFDHCSPDDVDKLRGPQTVVVANASAAAKLPGAIVLAPGERTMAAGLLIEALPAYNVNKYRAPGVHFHPKEAGHVGFLVTVQGLRVYFAGDCDYIPEMAQIDCDLALLPVSGTYVMTVPEAVEAAAAIGAAVTVPMHYGSGIGTETDGRDFEAAYRGRSAVLRQE